MADPDLLKTVQAATLVGRGRGSGGASRLISVEINSGRVSRAAIYGVWPDQAQANEIHVGMDVRELVASTERLVRQGYIAGIDEEIPHPSVYSVHSIELADLEAHDDWMIAFSLPDGSALPNYYEVHFENGAMSGLKAAHVDEF